MSFFKPFKDDRLISASVVFPFVRRYKIKRVLEIGLEAGTRLLMWAGYFPNAKIYGFEYL
jgi:hypothetical protein